VSRLNLARTAMIVMAVPYIVYSLAAAIGFCRGVPLWFMVPFFLVFFGLMGYTIRLARRTQAAHP